MFHFLLTLPAPCISKVNLNFYFHAPKRSMEIKFRLIFSLRPGSRREGLIAYWISTMLVISCYPVNI